MKLGNEESGVGCTETRSMAFIRPDKRVEKTVDENIKDWEKV